MLFKRIEAEGIAHCSYLIGDGGEPWVLDVRSGGELERAGLITGAHHIHVTELPERREEVPRDRAVYIFCGSGLRSMIAASLLKPAGWRDVSVVLGGIAGWRSVSCPIRQRRSN